MGCCNDMATTLAGVPPDPSQHVNFAKGMVLGVDDFTQEFAYHAGHAQWMARDTVGYGTLGGLDVSFLEDGADGPQLRVGAGSALTPSGRLVCVPASQCAVINKWLAKPDDAAIVTRRLQPLPPPAPAQSGAVSLYLTLCHAECLTRPVPIPGDPCRSSDALMSPSRVAEDFRLELREAAPDQVEEDALRAFVAWLRVNAHVMSGSPMLPGGEQAWLAALRRAVQPWLTAEQGSPPLSPPPSLASLGEYLLNLSPPGIEIGTGQLGDFLRVAMRFWVTELRPFWSARRCLAALLPDEDCLLLARVTFQATWIGGSPTGAWQVTGGPATRLVDESLRPFLLHQRLLQEWAISGAEDALETPPGGYVAQNLSAIGMPTFAGLSTTGAVQVAFTTVTAGLTLGDTHQVVRCNAAGPITVKVPACAPRNLGRLYTVKNDSLSAVTLACTGADQIDGAANQTLTTHQALTVISDGASGWHIVGKVA